MSNVRPYLRAPWLCLFLWLSNFSPSLVRADSVRLLCDDSAALIHRLELIESARSEILYSAYEVGDDPVALRLLAALREAARHGVCVKLIVDGHGQNNLIPKPLMEKLIGDGVKIREHMPDVRYKVELGRQRMHDKLFIIDGQQMIMGGRNLRADYFGMGERNYLDHELLLVGSTVQHARNYFLARWNSGTSGQPSLDRPEKKKTRERQELDFLNDMPRPVALTCADRLLNQALSTELPLSAVDCQRHRLQSDSEPFMEIDCIRFLHDIPGAPKDERAAIANQLCACISQAKRCIVMETPYPVFTHNLRHRLAEARTRGVEINIVTNSLETTDQVIVHAQYANERRWLRSQGIQLWEMKGEDYLHSKAMIIDHHLSMIGSYNFDVLSETRNSEVALLIDHGVFAAALAERIQRDMAMSQKVPVDKPLIGFDRRSNDVEEKVLREAQIKRLISPWIRKYL